jgi:hypothetical protein
MMAQESKDIRTILYSAYTSVRSQAVNTAISGVTIDHLLQEHIISLKQSSSQTVTDDKGPSRARPSKLDELLSLQESINSVYSSILKAGSDPSKLESLGLYGVDSETNDDTARSELAEEVKKGSI